LFYAFVVYSTRSLQSHIDAAKFRMIKDSEQYEGIGHSFGCQGSIGDSIIQVDCSKLILSTARESGCDRGYCT
jgi:hypothetical protein